MKVGKLASLALVVASLPVTMAVASADPSQAVMTTAVATGPDTIVVATNQGLMRFIGGAADTSYGPVALPFAATWLGYAGGDVVAVGGSRAARVLPTGHLDASFGQGGIVDTGGFGRFPLLDGDRLLLQSASSIERLTASGSADASFGTVALPAGPGPIAIAPAGYDLATHFCRPVPLNSTVAPCGMEVDRLRRDGTFQPPTDAALSGSGFVPQEISTAFAPDVLAVGDQDEVLIRPDGTLDATFGQATCGQPEAFPSMPGGRLHLLADGRTLDLTTPGADTPDLYDIVTHVFVRAHGRKDTSFGAGGHVSLPSLGGTAVFLTSSRTTAWFAVSQDTSLVAVPLGPSAPRLGPPATFGQRLIGVDGGVLNVAPLFGTAPAPCGSMAGHPLAQPMVGATPSPDGVGYWLVARDGGVFSFGDSTFFGSTGAIRLNEPIVGMAATPDGRGYWLVAADGGIFAYGDAPFLGSTGAIRLNSPIVGMAPASDGLGYWLVAADGGVFAFGDAPYLGSAAQQPLHAPAVGILRTRSGNGYWVAIGDGAVYTYGDAGYGDVRSVAPIVGISSGVPDTFNVVNAAGAVRNSDFGPIPQPVTPSAPLVGIIASG